MGIDVPAAKRPALIDPGDAGAQPFREIDLCLGGGRNESGHVVVFASAWPGEGTTTVASNYAIAASRREQRVLLVDANLDGPSLHALFDVPRTPGLVDILSYELTIDDLVHEIDGSGGWLGVLTAGSPAANTADVLGSPAVTRILETERAARDIVVVDTPGVLGNTGTRALAVTAKARVVLVVAESGRTRTLIRTLRALDEVAADVAGLVINDVPAYELH